MRDAFQIPEVHVIGVRRGQGTGAERFKGGGRAHREDLAGPGDRERPQEQRVGEAEDRAVGADADRQ